MNDDHKKERIESIDQLIQLTTEYCKLYPEDSALKASLEGLKKEKKELSKTYEGRLVEQIVALQNEVSDLRIKIMKLESEKYSKINPYVSRVVWNNNESLPFGGLRL